MAGLDLGDWVALTFILLLILGGMVAIVWLLVRVGARAWFTEQQIFMKRLEQER